jgi:hypothetical protein
MAKLQEYEQEVNQLEDQDVFYTPPLDAPPSEPEAHRAVVVSVTGKNLNNDKQTALVEITLQSRDVPTRTEVLNVWLPKEFELTGIGNPRFDPKTLAEGQQISYRLGIAAKDGKATLQMLATIAKEAGRSSQGLKTPTNLTEYAENYNTLAQGIELVMLLRERGGDNPAFAHRLEPKGIVSATEIETNPKRFKNYVRKWETE